MNVGMADRVIRIAVGAALVALALDLLPISTPYNYLGWIGVIPLLPRHLASKTRLSKKDGNALQVRMELQADCLAGVWARHADREKSILEPGDVEEAMNAASAIGDDRIQQKTQGRVVPDAFTHGSSRQRVRWFRQGFDSGDVQKCDTFRARNL